MKFKNISQKPIMLKLGDKWSSIEPESYIDLPGRIGKREEGLEQIEETKKEEVKKEKVKILSKKELQGMTKDDINDYAARNFPDSEINSQMLKKEMIKKVMELQGNAK